MRKTRVWFTCLLILTMLLSMTGVALAKGNKDGSGKGKGAVEPYALSLQALQGQEHTDLYVSAASQLSGYDTPSEYKKIQLKSYTDEGELVYTRNFNNGVSAPEGTATIELTDVERYQPLETQVIIQNDQSKKAQVLSAVTHVLLRPDLIVDKVDAPAQALVNAPFSVSSVIKELNGDVPSDATVTILNGDQVLDTASNVEVPAGGVQAISFLLNFDTPGTYHLTAQISGVNPGEYDVTNNEMDFTVEVISPNKTMYYSAEYHYENYDIHYKGFNVFSGYKNFHHHEEYETYSIRASTRDRVNPVGSLIVQLEDVDGLLQDLEADVSSLQFTDYGNGLKYYTAYYPEINGSLWITQTNYETMLTFTRQAGHYLYSENYFEIIYHDEWNYGQFMRANGTIYGHLELQDANGTLYGGDYSFDIPPYYEDTWDTNVDGWLDHDTHYWGTEKYIWVWDSGETEWE